MKLALPGLISLCLTLGLAGTACADVWSAKCNGMQFHFDRATKKATIEMVSAGGVGFEVTTGTIKVDNGVALRAIVSAAPIADDDPVVEVGLNKSRNIVYLVRHNSGSGEVKDGVFCETPITVGP